MSHRPSRLTPSPAFVSFSGLLQLSDAGVDIFDLDCLGGMVEDAVRGPHSGRRRRCRIQHDLAERLNSRARQVVQSGDGLAERRALRRPIGCVELGFLHPSVQSSGIDANRASRFFDTPGRQQCQDRRFPLAS